MAKIGKTILLIEDDAELIDLYTITLTKVDHFKVKVIKYGRKALEWIKEVKAGKAKKPDLILLDLILPDMNGLDFLKEMRKEKETKDLPVFILTNYSSYQLEELGYKLKSEKYLKKTEYPPKELLKVIKERLERRK